MRLGFSEVEADEPLGKSQYTAFRGVAARANYLAADRIKRHRNLQGDVGPHSKFLVGAEATVGISLASCGTY